MESMQIAALSKIADILADNNKSPLIPETDVWKKIFSNAELEYLYTEREPQFRVISNSSEKYFNDKTYNALYESFKELQYSFDDLVKLMNSIASKMYIYRVFLENAEKEIKRELSRIKGNYLDEILSYLDSTQRNLILNKYCNSSFRVLKCNLNVIGLDVVLYNQEFGIQPFIESSSENITDLNVISQWLYSNYNNVFKSYEDAKKAYSIGDKVGCITHCRSVITGIFSYKKDDGTEWYRGLQKVCNSDKNICNIHTAKNIPKIRYEVHSPKVEERYQYPRFNLINKLYVFTCDLGAHNNEGNINGDGEIDFETTVMEDALLALRMTEDVLIWLYQTGRMN